MRAGLQSAEHFDHEVARPIPHEGLDILAAFHPIEGTMRPREFRLGPRSPIFIWVILLPLAMSFLISAVFGSLLDPEARLGIVDLGSSEITIAAQDLDGILVSLVGDPDRLQSQVEAHDLDAGLVLAALPERVLAPVVA